MNRLIQFSRMLLPLGLLALSLAGREARPVSAGALAQNSCCPARQTTVELDPRSYKIWPSGSRTFVAAQWSSAAGSASFTVLNPGISPAPALTATVEVIDHNPMTQTPIDDVTYSYPIPALAPGGSVNVAVPLDPSQCDIFVTIDLGSGGDTVLRTGNPAAC